MNGDALRPAKKDRREMRRRGALRRMPYQLGLARRRRRDGARVGPHVVHVDERPGEQPGGEVGPRELGPLLWRWWRSFARFESEARLRRLFLQDEEPAGIALRLVRREVEPEECQVTSENAAEERMPLLRRRFERATSRIGRTCCVDERRRIVLQQIAAKEEYERRRLRWPDAVGAEVGTRGPRVDGTDVAQIAE